MFSAILFHANLYFENQLGDFTFVGYIFELSMYAFIGMKYDSANFQLPITSDGCHPNTIACTAYVRNKSQLSKTAISLGKFGFQLYSKCVSSTLKIGLSYVNTEL